MCYDLSLEQIAFLGGIAIPFASAFFFIIFDRVKEMFSLAILAVESQERLLFSLLTPVSNGLTLIGSLFAMDVFNGELALIIGAIFQLLSLGMGIIGLTLYSIAEDKIADLKTDALVGRVGELIKVLKDIALKSGREKPEDWAERQVQNMSIAPPAYKIAKLVLPKIKKLNRLEKYYIYSICIFNGCATFYTLVGLFFIMYGLIMVIM